MYTVVFNREENNVGMPINAAARSQREVTKYTAAQAAAGASQSRRLGKFHARQSNPPHHGILVRLPVPNCAIQRYSAWVCSRAINKVQPITPPAPHAPDNKPMTHCTATAKTACASGEKSLMSGHLQCFNACCEFCVLGQQSLIIATLQCSFESQSLLISDAVS